MKPSGERGVRSDSGYRKLAGDEGDNAKGYGSKGAGFLRRGRATGVGGEPAVHLCDFMCKSHRLQVRSSYAPETLGAARDLDERHATLIALREMTSGAFLPSQL